MCMSFPRRAEKRGDSPSIIAPSLVPRHGQWMVAKLYFLPRVVDRRACGEFGLPEEILDRLLGRWVKEVGRRFLQRVTSWSITRWLPNSTFGALTCGTRSEERRVGKECRARWWR